MSELFKYLNPIRSKDFNDRFSDVAGGSLLSGFYFEKGDLPFSITLTHKHDPSNILILKNGVRIEEKFPLENVLEIQPNTYSTIRKDYVYANYQYGRNETIVEYRIFQNPEGVYKEPYLDWEQNLILGAINIPPSATSLDDCTFEYVKRGIHLKNIANDVSVLGKLSILQKAEQPDDALSLKDMSTALETYDSVESRLFDLERDMFGMVNYKRSDGTLFAQSIIKEWNEAKRASRIECTRFESDGYTVKETFNLFIDYDEHGSVINLYKI